MTRTIDEVLAELDRLDLLEGSVLVAAQMNLRWLNRYRLERQKLLEELRQLTTEGNDNAGSHAKS